MDRDVIRDPDMAPPLTLSLRPDGCGLGCPRPPVLLPLARWRGPAARFGERVESGFSVGGLLRIPARRPERVEQRPGLQVDLVHLLGELDLDLAGIVHRLLESLEDGLQPLS